MAKEGVMEVLLDNILHWMGLKDLPGSEYKREDPFKLRGRETTEYRPGDFTTSYKWTVAERRYPAGTSPDGRERQVAVQVQGLNLKVFNLVTENGRSLGADYGFKGVLVPSGRTLSSVFVTSLFYNQEPGSKVFDSREIEADSGLTEPHVHALCAAFGNAIRGQIAIGTQANLLQMDPPVPGKVVYLFRVSERPPGECTPPSVCRG